MGRPWTAERTVFLVGTLIALAAGVQGVRELRRQTWQ